VQHGAVKVYSVSFSYKIKEPKNQWHNRAHTHYYIAAESPEAAIELVKRRTDEFPDPDFSSIVYRGALLLA
jgi:predicted Zn-dependent protease